MWIAFKGVCFRSFGNLIDAPRSGEGGGAIRSSTRIQNPKIRVPGWPLHRHLSNGPLSKPTAIQTLLESGLEQTGRIRQDAFQFPQTCCKDTLPTHVRRWESLDPRWATVRVSNIQSPSVRTGTGPGDNCPDFFHYLSISGPQSLGPESGFVCPICI